MIFGPPKTLPKRPQAPKPIFWALEYEYSGNQVPKFEECQKKWNLCSLKFSADWTIHFSKRAHERPK